MKVTSQFRDFLRWLFFGLCFVVLFGACIHSTFRGEKKRYLTASGKKPLVIAHRGASGYLPEHTLASVAMAHGWRVDYIEPDVVLSKDGVPMVLHDIHLESTTDVEQVFPKRKRKDGRWYAIDFSLEEIRRLHVHERAKGEEPRFPARFPVSPQFLKVPTLEEFIDLVQGMNQSTGREVGIYPEIKAPSFHRQSGQDITKIVLELLNRKGYSKRSDLIYVQCFEPKALIRLREEFKTDLKLVQLLGESRWKMNDVDYDFLKSSEGIKAMAKYADGVGPSLGQLVDGNGKVTGLLREFRRQGLEVHPYTFRKDRLPPYVSSYRELLKKFFGELKVDGVFTDFGDLTVEFLNSP